MEAFTISTVGNTFLCAIFVVSLYTTLGCLVLIILNKIQEIMHK